MTSTDTAKYLEVTELAGEEISQEQLERMAHRYYWSKKYCEGKDVVETACGTGQGLGYLNSISKSFIGSDISDEVLESPRAHYGDRVKILTLNADTLPFEDDSVDTLLVYEALYYIPNVENFFAETRRVLRNDGHILIVSANKDLYDFNPSPHSHTYLGVVELKQELEKAGFEIVEMAGGTPIASVSWKQKILRPIKKIVVQFNLMPKTMTGKKLLKRLVFGQMVQMPAELTADMCEYVAPTPIANDQKDMGHKVIYCAAKVKK